MAQNIAENKQTGTGTRQERPHLETSNLTNPKRVNLDSPDTKKRKSSLFEVPYFNNNFLEYYCPKQARELANLLHSMTMTEKTSTEVVESFSGSFIENSDLQADSQMYNGKENSFVSSWDIERAKNVDIVTIIEEINIEKSHCNNQNLNTKLFYEIVTVLRTMFSSAEMKEHVAYVFFFLVNLNQVNKKKPLFTTVNKIDYEKKDYESMFSRNIPSKVHNMLCFGSSFLDRQNEIVFWFDWGNSDKGYSIVKQGNILIARPGTSQVSANGVHLLSFSYSPNQKVQAFVKEMDESSNCFVQGLPSVTNIRTLVRSAMIDTLKTVKTETNVLSNLTPEQVGNVVTIAKAFNPKMLENLISLASLTPEQVKKLIALVQ